MSQFISDFKGNTLYLDTMVFHTLLRTRAAAVEQLFQRIETGSLRAYTSVLTFDELAYRMLLALVRDKYSGSPLDRLRQDERNMIAEFYPQLAPQLEYLQSFPHLYVVDVTPTDLTAMNQLILQHHLRPRDALHLAAMHKCGCFNLVSQDTDFDQIPGVRRYTLL